ncbi:MAG TPA: hypothetical protein VJI15_03915 [Candidatus Nanoarchaeia archaeon]|nr:hypothetical protein [Candidatus Nanoarchaeia archaeon]
MLTVKKPSHLAAIRQEVESIKGKKGLERAAAIQTIITKISRFSALVENEESLNSASENLLAKVIADVHSLFLLLNSATRELMRTEKETGNIRIDSALGSLREAEQQMHQVEEQLAKLISYLAKEEHDLE